VIYGIRLPDHNIQALAGYHGGDFGHLGIGKLIHGGFVKGEGHGVVHIDLCIFLKVDVLTEALVKVIIYGIGFTGRAAVYNDAGKSGFKPVIIHG